jgi:hypothetical protein
MATHTSQNPVVQYAQHPVQLHRIVDTYGRTPAPPAPSMAIFVNGMPVAWFTDDQVAAILAEHLERSGHGRA